MHISTGEWLCVLCVLQDTYRSSFDQRTLKCVVTLSSLRFRCDVTPKLVAPHFSELTVLEWPQTAVKTKRDSRHKLHDNSELQLNSLMGGMPCFEISPVSEIVGTLAAYDNGVQREEQPRNTYQTNRRTHFRRSVPWHA